MHLHEIENCDEFNEFLTVWNKQYENVKYILAYLSSYPELLSKTKLTEIHNPHSLDSAQNEWVRLISKFTHPIDIEFFKQYYVPIQVDSIDYFIDISDGKYPIFEIHYFFYEPFKWYKKFVVEDICELLLAPDTGLDLPKLLDENDKKRWSTVHEFFAERKRLGYEGKLYVEPVKKNEFMHKAKDGGMVTFELKGQGLDVLGVTSIVAGLLPFSMPIKLKNIEYLYTQPIISLKDVKIIRDLVFLLRETGVGGVKSYNVELLDSSHGALKYKENSFVLSHPKREVLDDFVDKLMTCT
jgi:hypothetical protein